jgi:hypothetical protein
MRTPAALDRSTARDEARALATQGGSFWMAMAALGVVAIPAAMLVQVARGEPYGAAAALAPLLVLAMVPVLRRIAVREGDHDLTWILLLGLELRLLASIPRWLEGVDATVYVRVGRELAPQLRNLDFALDVDRSIPGTGTIRYLAAVTQVLFNDNAELATVLFTLFGFVGCVLIYQAACVALPDLNHRWMALAIALWPSLVYWPSSIGKEAVVLLGIGLLTLGASRRFQHQGGTMLVLTGAAVTGLVRPHITLLLFGSLLVAVVLAANTTGKRGWSLGKWTLVAVLIVGLAVSSGEALELVESADFEDTAEFLEDRTAQGGSAFEARPVRGPLDFPLAVVTVLVRPFPWEASSGLALMAAAEGMLLLSLGVLRLGHLVTLVGSFRTRPLVGFALIYLAAFCFAFSGFANFGLLARQRTQAIPILLLLLTLPATLAIARPSRREAPRRSAIGWDLTVEPDVGLPAEPQPSPGARRWRSNTVGPPER